MGKMKWIYNIVQNGDSDMFLDAYKKARFENSIGFTFDNKFIDVIQGKAICNEIKKAEKEYDKHIDEIAMNHVDLLHDIVKGE